MPHRNGNKHGATKRHNGNNGSNGNHEDHARSNGKPSTRSSINSYATRDLAERIPGAFVRIRDAKRYAASTRRTRRLSKLASRLVEVILPYSVGKSVMATMVAEMTKALVGVELRAERHARREERERLKRALRQTSHGCYIGEED
jgi:hypothetical protein